MKRRTWLIGVAVLAVVGAGLYWRGVFSADKGAARAQGTSERVVTVEVAKAVRKRVPVQLEALGTVTPIASVSLKARVDTTITEVHFRDGAHVNAGDLLFSLDCRQVEADMKRVQAVIDGAQASFEQAQRDVVRYKDLVDRNATPIVTLNNAQTAVNVSKATAESNRAQLDSLKVQLGFCSMRAPIGGRISMANVKVGNFVRQADTAPMATIIQTSPVYVTFPVPQKFLPDIRQAIAAETGSVEATVSGEKKTASGQITMIENSVDVATGTAIIRATMPNTDELLWPGSLVTTVVTLRQQDDVVVPTAAVQTSQTGTFVFVIKDNKAVVTPVKVARTIRGETAIESGLNGDETVVTDGQLQLTNGRTVQIRTNKAGA